MPKSVTFTGITIVGSGFYTDRRDPRRTHATLTRTEHRSPSSDKIRRCPPAPRLPFASTPASAASCMPSGTSSPKPEKSRRRGEGPVPEHRRSDHFGFRTPPHMIEAVERAMRDGDNGYAPSVGILPAREAVAAECLQRGMPMSADRVVITGGHIRRDRAGADGDGGPGRRGADPGAHLSPLYRGAREDWRPRGVLPDRSRETAGSPTSITSAAWSHPRRGRWSSSIRTTRPARPIPTERPARPRRSRGAAQLPAARGRGLRAT